MTPKGLLSSPRCPVPIAGPRSLRGIGLALQLGAAFVIAALVLGILRESPGFDAHAYWAASLDHPYGAVFETRDAYLYSPAFLQAIAPLKLLPFDVFFAVWVLCGTATLVWLAGPVPAALLLIPGSYSAVYVDLWFGNIMIFMAAALTVGLRYPAAWSFMLLTKLTPGIGLIWFAVRAEWRALAIALATTAALVLISVVLAPGLWTEWLEALRANAATPEVAGWEAGTWPIRMGLAALLIAVAARLDAAWVLPLALFVAQPLTWFIGFALGLAWLGWWRHPRLRPDRRRAFA